MISPDLGFRYTRDLFTDTDEIIFESSVYFITTKEGVLAPTYLAIKESWQGQEYKLNQMSLYGKLRLNKWLKIEGNYSCGDRIFYDAVPAYKGKGSDGFFSIILQPNKKINQYFEFTHSDLSRDGEKIYDVNILYSWTTYQFNKYFFLRAVIQHDNFQKRLLTDFLASFTLIPGTVLHVGYGGLYENREWKDSQWVYRRGEMINIKRSLFVKVSYLWRF
jgi:hypothetical protein